MPRTKKTTEQGQYEAVLFVNNDEFRAVGDDLTKLLLDLKPSMFKTKGVVIVKSGEKIAQKVYQIPMLRRLFHNDTTRTVLAKNLIALLK